ncbi:MAG TPA: lipopolysaccharide heptosyltransferase I [Burkholderiaceae bacterium]|nr:lipopolysaccharide heptosyltransferase I [Burkholderiaceae bacterium]
MPTAPRFLIVKTSSMGDVVHALPAVSDIARAVPGAQIDWVVEEGFAALPRLHPNVARVLPIALRRWRRTWWRPSTWREYLAARTTVATTRYDRIIDCQGLVKSAWVARWGDGPVYGPDRTSAREPFAARLYDHPLFVARPLHAIERNRRLVAGALDRQVEGPPQFGLRVPSLTQRDLLALAAGGPFAVLLTNASRATKLWPDDAWRAVEARLAQQGLRSVLFWGSDEEAVATRARAHGMRAAWVAPRIGLDQLVACLARARVVVGLDTGLSHLAAAVAAPTVGVFCDYDPALVGITGPAPCISLGSASGGPPAAEVIAAAEHVLAATAADGVLRGATA